MPQDLLISVEFTSDWHIGTGAGRQGSVDRLVRRDAVDDLPCVPGKTLTGMLRDACEAVAHGLDVADGGSGVAWTTLLDEVFGDQPSRAQRAARKAPVQASLAVGPACFQQPLRDQLRSRPDLARALTFIKPGVRIDAKTGQAQEKHLRMIEVVRGGVTLVSEATFDLGRLREPCHEAAHALLWAGARVLDHIGGQRRRGLGRCRVTVTPKAGAFSQARLDAFKALLSDPLNAFALADGGTESSGRQLQTSAASQGGAWRRIGLAVHVDRPVVVPASVVGNAVNSLDYIPGTHLIGHVLRTLGGPDGTAWLFPYLASGELRVLNAYLTVNDRRGRPVPFSYRYLKALGGLGTGGSAKNEICETWPEGDQTKPHRVGFLAPCGSSNLTLETMRFVETTHATINDAQQRPIETEVGVYTYHALRPGVRLRSELCVTEAVATELDTRSPGWVQRLSGTARIGVAKKDDYGKVAIAVCEADEPSARAPGSSVTVWLLSDVLIRDASLRPSTDIADLRAAIEDELNRDCAPELHVALMVDADTARPRVRRTDGWQTSWQLPKPTLIGLQAGTVVRFATAGAPPPDLADRLERLERGGLGERRGEGFGELVVNDPLAASQISDLSGTANVAPRFARPATPASAANVSAANGGVDAVLTRLEREAWRAAYRHKVAVWASDSARRRAYFDWNQETPRDDRPADKPKNSQLGALRQLAMTFEGPSSLISEWLAAQKERTKWTGKGLAAIENLVMAATEAWGSLPIQNAASMTGESALPPALRKELWPEAVRTLLLVAIRQEVRQREKEARGTTSPPDAAGLDQPAAGAAQ